MLRALVCDDQAMVRAGIRLILESQSDIEVVGEDGTVIAVGELLGGGLAPIMAGQFAEKFGLSYLLWLPIGAVFAGFLLSLFLKETLPSAVKSPSAR